MNNKVLLLLPLLIGILLSCKEGNLNDPDLKDENTTIHLDSKTEYLSEYEGKLVKDLKRDTSYIEHQMDSLMNEDASTHGMIQALYKAESQYDSLLNVYYRNLKQRLSEEDQSALLQTQKAWLNFRDQQINLNQVLAKDDYSGGGSIQNVKLASLSLNLTKDRLIEIVEMLKSMPE